MRTITLTTDFGLGDWFAGTMKAVILGIHPRANVVDITHEIPPGDIRAGAFALMAGCRYIPKGWHEHQSRIGVWRKGGLLINTVASARCGKAAGAVQPFQRFAWGRGKPLKRLGWLAAYVHRAEAAVLMRPAASLQNVQATPSSSSVKR